MSVPLPGNSTSATAAAIALAASLAPNTSGSGGAKRRFADPEYIAMSEFLNTVGEVDDQDPNNVSHNGSSNAVATTTTTNSSNNGGMNSTAQQQKRARTSAAGAPRRSAQAAAHEAAARRDQLVPVTKNREPHRSRTAAANGARPHSDTLATTGDRKTYGDDDVDVDDNASDRSDKSSSGRHAASSRHTKLTELEARVRSLERDNLHLKQTLLLGTNGSVMLAGHSSRETTQRLLSERTKIVTEMVEQLNASFLTIGDASRVWHQDCRIGVGVREWDAFGRLQTISLWNMIRSIFATIAVDIVELRPHLPDGEMILTKWRIQGEIASPAQLEAVCLSEDCPATMKVALMAIKSSDLTFTVTTYVIFQDAHIAEQHHCWDQVGVFKRLFGGEIPATVKDMLRITADDNQ